MRQNGKMASPVVANRFIRAFSVSTFPSAFVSASTVWRVGGLARSPPGHATCQAMQCSRPAAVVLGWPR